MYIGNTSYTGTYASWYFFGKYLWNVRKIAAYIPDSISTVRHMYSDHIYQGTLCNDSISTVGHMYSDHMYHHEVENTGTFAWQLHTPPATIGGGSTPPRKKRDILSHDK